MAVVSGKDGYATFSGITDITSWSISLESNNPSYACTSTAGYKKRVAGVKDATATIEGVVGDKPPMPGTTGTCVLYIDGSDTYTFDAIVESSTHEANIEDGEIVKYTIELAVQGTTSAEPTGWA
jgi:hypothetical protein